MPIIASSIPQRELKTSDFDATTDSVKSERPTGTESATAESIGGGLGSVYSKM
jgi:hypothetical protein